MPRKDKIKKGLKEKSGAELFLQKDEYTEKQEAANDFVLNAVDYLRNLENADDAFKEIKNLNDDEPVKGTKEFKESSRWRRLVKYSLTTRNANCRMKRRLPPAC